jgi:hypothetical protein
MAAASITPAANDMSADSWRLLTRCTRNTGRAPTAVASAASSEACTPAVMALLAPVASHQTRVGAQKVLPAASPAISNRPVPSANRVLRSACGGTGSSRRCICNHTGWIWRMRAVMAGSWQGVRRCFQPFWMGSLSKTIEKYHLIALMGLIAAAGSAAPGHRGQNTCGSAVLVINN